MNDMHLPDTFRPHVRPVFARCALGYLGRWGRAFVGLGSRGAQFVATSRDAFACLFAILFHAVSAPRAGTTNSTPIAIGSAILRNSYVRG